MCVAAAGPGRREAVETVTQAYRKGKLKLPALPSEWLDAVLNHHGLSVLPLDLATCVRATELPTFHADPCDRFIIASAQTHNLPVVTGDTRFWEYGITVLS